MSVVDIGSDSAPEFFHAAKVVGTTAEVIANARPLLRGAQVVAATDNLGVVFVGTSQSVTAGTNDGTDGFPLGPGDGLFVPVDDLAKVWVIADQASQKVFWVAI
ncbi:MAG: hypothetical protein DWQ31_17010 [Planctomycetota bacterium]|nr:MAG: hypothetical protein DWQ31_17010 [Planctomycetota bacterium]REJ92055.1 MAG: hypothetical protein DWQ35_12960 [Planctomycetota bacterium]REK28591.1 MAG: hypothetical protein DWQ42_04550 [Planctomycetota bacterium]REK39206.1 MAG: hypothetical protein DWQ46_18135 [Planctomycetota bacterium]